MHRFALLLFVLFVAWKPAHAQSDSGAARAKAASLPTVTVTADRYIHVIGHLPAVQYATIYTGKKTELIVMDSLRANMAQDVERQILGRIPGAHFSETEGAGFPSNGVAFRGLDPTQSVEMNVRQNGVSIAADLFGYPETYYTPPSEALERIEVVRGAASLAFGPQFGGVIDYIVRDGQPQSAPKFTSSLSGGSFGLANSFNSVGGGSDRLTYYAFVHGRSQAGWRPNSDVRQLSGFGRLTYRVSDQLTVSSEYTVSRNRIHMAGGLNDSTFALDPRVSFRSRNWLTSPWSIAVLRARYDVAAHARLETTLSYVDGSRALVWRNEEGGPVAPDLIEPATGERIPREVEDEQFRTTTLESRLRLDHQIAGASATLATGLRLSQTYARRLEGGPGSTNSDFDLTLVGGDWERSLQLKTMNAALFAEDLIHLGDRVSIVPGIRLESVRSAASGYTDVTSSFSPTAYRYPLAGIGASAITSSTTELYANVSQAYRPVLYSSITPFGSIARISPTLHAARGGNADMGWRGTAGDAIKFDVGAFYLWYGDRIGTRTVAEGQDSFTEVANVGSSEHRGVESYVEVDPFPLLGISPHAGALDLFSSLGYVDARYVSGEFKGNRVEQAPTLLSRLGVTYALGRISNTLQVSHTSESFGDANNSRTETEDAAGGLIPSYTILDWSAAIRAGGEATFTFGINNVANARYFTKRTAEYPGPGILPGIGRSVYVGLRVGY
ncbi:TonB-dependent receptor [soil metagenome]